MTEKVQKLRQLIAAADEDALIGLANKGTYKRACKDAEGLTAEFEEGDDCITLNFGGETVTLRSPLENSTCSCPSRAVCRHIIGALVLMKGVIPADEAPAPAEKPAPEEKTEKPRPAETPAVKQVQAASPAPQVKYLSDKDEARVHDCASLCRGLLGEILTDGLVRMPDDMPARIEAAAVRCHGLKAADAERVMRKVGGLLTAHLQRRASFSDHEFARKLCEADTLLAALEKGRLTEEALGEFRRSYEPLAGELSLLPIGARDVSGSEYKGEIYYFLDENRTSGRDFLTISDMRPTYYEGSTRSRRVPPLSPWDLGATLSSVMKSKLVLVGAKVSGEKLSSSAETKVASQTKASLNCPAVHKLIIDDFRQIAAELDEAGEYETDRMFFIHPTKCCYHRFDKYSQNFIMEIEDWRGCRIKVKAKFRAETRSFIELLEKIARRMVGNTDANYTILGTASVQNGELTIFPIEIYDFIDYFDDKQYFLPEKYDGTEAFGDYAERLLSLFTRLRNTLAFIVHCGLRSEIRDEDKLTKRAENCGMAHLAELTSALLDGASAYRHSLSGDAGSILQKMTALYEYIELGEKRLQTISALAKMQPEKLTEEQSPF